MSKRFENPYELTVNGKTFNLEAEVYGLLVATSKERDTLRENYASLEGDYDVVNERALETALKLGELDKEFAAEFENDEFWKIVVAHVQERQRRTDQKRLRWS